jgi:hypothetical protein
VVCPLAQLSARRLMQSPSSATSVFHHWNEANLAPWLTSFAACWHHLPKRPPILQPHEPFAAVSVVSFRVIAFAVKALSCRLAVSCLLRFIARKQREKLLLKPFIFGSFAPVSQNSSMPDCCESLILRWVARHQKADAVVKARSPVELYLLGPFI